MEYLFFVKKKKNLRAQPASPLKTTVTTSPQKRSTAVGSSRFLPGSPTRGATAVLDNPGHGQGLTQPGFVKQSGRCSEDDETWPLLGRSRAGATLSSHQGGEGPTRHICQPTVGRLLAPKCRYLWAGCALKGHFKRSYFLRKGKMGVMLTKL